MEKMEAQRQQIEVFRLAAWMVQTVCWNQAACWVEKERVIVIPVEACHHLLQKASDRFQEEEVWAAKQGKLVPDLLGEIVSYAAAEVDQGIRRYTPLRGVSSEGDAVALANPNC